MESGTARGQLPLAVGEKEESRGGDRRYAPEEGGVASLTRRRVRLSVSPVSEFTGGKEGAAWTGTPTMEREPGPLSHSDPRCRRGSHPGGGRTRCVRNSRRTA